jgi:hypothetical protein
MVNLLDAGRDWFKSRGGIPQTQWPSVASRERSPIRDRVCGEALELLDERGTG